MIIAAKFNANVDVGWPELQIIRRENNSQRIAFRTNATEPRSIGYFNVYEYELSYNFDVKMGDVLNISWHGDVTQPDQIRFSLAYYNNGISRVPMVSIIVGDCDSDTDLLTLDSLYCEDTMIPTTGSTTTTPATRRLPITSTDGSEARTVSDAGAGTSATSTAVTIIIGVVVISLFLLIIILSILVVFTFMVKRRKKSVSVNATDSTEMGRYANQPQMLHNARKNLLILITILFLSAYAFSRE